MHSRRNNMYKGTEVLGIRGTGRTHCGRVWACRWKGESERRPGGGTLKPGRGATTCSAEKAEFLCWWWKTSGFCYLFNTTVWMFQAYLPRCARVEGNVWLRSQLWGCRNTSREKWWETQIRVWQGGWGSWAELRDTLNIEVVDFLLKREKSRRPPYFYVENHWSVTPVIWRRKTGKGASMEVAWERWWRLTVYCIWDTARLSPFPVGNMDWRLW